MSSDQAPKAGASARADTPTRGARGLPSGNPTVLGLQGPRPVSWAGKQAPRGSCAGRRKSWDNGGWRTDRQTDRCTHSPQFSHLGEGGMLPYASRHPDPCPDPVFLSSTALLTPWHATEVTVRGMQCSEHSSSAPEAVPGPHLPQTDWMETPAGARG